MTKHDAAQSLADVLHLLPKGRQDFANSLLDQLNRRGDLSQNQWFWVVKLTGMAGQPAPVAPVAMGDISPIVRLIEGARTRLKWPALLIGGGTSRTLRITVAGDRSREPGAINVCDANETDQYGKRLFLGRIGRDGRLVLRDTCRDPQAVVDQLVTFAADPVAAAREYGRRTGFCCFCAKELTDERSTSVGYGPICADKWQLPWAPSGLARPWKPNCRWPASFPVATPGGPEGPS